MSCSLRKWFCDLPWMQQGVLLGAIRNCDGFDSEGSSALKTLTRGIRCTCIKAAISRGSFNARRPTLEQIVLASDAFCKALINNVPVHFVNHLMMGAEVIGYSHPDEDVAHAWLSVYKKLVNHFHLRVEPVEAFIMRLRDDQRQVLTEDAYDEKCYSTGIYGDNNGIVNEVV